MIWVTIVAAALFFARPAAAEELPEFRYRATRCENSYYFVPTTAARARGAGVPKRFAILGEPAGIAIVGVMVVSCDVSLNGGPKERTNWSEVGVLIAPPTGLNLESVTFDLYRLWHVTDREEWLQLNEAWDIPTSEAAVDTSYKPGLLIATSSGYVDHEDGAYSHHGIFEGIVHPGLPGVVSWWTLGEHGLTRFDQQFTNDTEQCGIGKVKAEGRMAALIGKHGLGIHGCVVFADLIGRARVAEQP